MRHSYSQEEPACLSIGEYECPSALYTSEFIVAAGVVMFHRKSKRVVLVTDEINSKAGWFFPKGRKNIGEAVHDAAVREVHDRIHIFPHLVHLFFWIMGCLHRKRDDRIK